MATSVEEQATPCTTPTVSGPPLDARGMVQLNQWGDSTALPASKLLAAVSKFNY